MGNKPPTLLCVNNMKSTRGYAWYFIGRLYAQVADRLAPRGIRTLVAYPSIPAPPPALAGSTAQAILLDASLTSLQSLISVRQFIKSENIRVIYFTDRPARNWKYPLLRQAGVGRIVVHDHISGEQTRPKGLKRLVKYILARTPGMAADVLVTVSNYVAQRDMEVGLIPRERVFRVWNGIPLPQACNHNDKTPFLGLGIAPERPHIVCACRATPEKGVAYLLRAFEQLVSQLPANSAKPVLIYYGDGPQLEELRALREKLIAKDSIFLLGQVSDVGPALDAADICVVPSVWQDAFPLSVLEAMGRGKPVIASRVGGIPEMIEDGVSGLLVPPGDENALVMAIGDLLADSARTARLAEAARRRVADEFKPETQIESLVRIVGAGFGIAV